MSESRPKKFWRLFRVYFRRFRISVLLVLLSLVIGLFYLNQIGLPDFLKSPLLEQLRARGIDFEYGRLRLRLFHGIVAENVRFGRARQSGIPELTAARVELPLNQQALIHGQIIPEGLMISEGRLSWEVPELDTNRPPRTIEIEKISTTLDLESAHRWELNNFSASFRGGRVTVSGVITNGTALRKWLAPRPKQKAPQPGLAAARLRFWADLLDRVEFAAPPQVEVRLRGDALDPKSFFLELRASAPGARTPWCDLTGGILMARMLPEDTNGLGQARVRVKAATAETPWASATNLLLELNLTSRQAETNLVVGKVSLAVSSASTRWASARDLKLGGQWTHALTNPIPLEGRADVQCALLETPWGNAGAASIEGAFRRLSQPPAPNPAIGFWNGFLPYELDWSVAASQLVSTTNRAGELFCSGSWRAPELRLNKLEGRFDGRRLDVEGGLDVASRELRAHVNSQADPHQVPMLPSAALKWLSQFTWNGPPVLQADARLILPSWTNHPVNWREVVPTIQLAGDFDVDKGGTFRGIEVSAAKGRFTYTNQIWRLPALQASRPEGNVEAEHWANEVTHEHYWKFLTTVDPRIAEPLLEPSARQIFKLISLEKPPRITGELWDHSRRPDLTGFKGTINVTNLGFRGETCSVLRAGIQFTNNQITVTKPELQRGTQLAQADSVVVDLEREVVHITNGFSTVEPQYVARMIGPHIVKILRPYQFAQPPTVRVQGTVPTHGEEDADITFDIDGGRFSWWKFNVHTISALVHWQGTNLDLSHLHSQFYGGEADGDAHFRFQPGGEAIFNFDITVTNAFLQLLMADLATKTNQLEGLVSGRVRVTRATTDDPNSADGYGTLRMRDGLIWDIPLFGVLTGPLNNLSPGLGSSRIGSATCTFQMTNSVLWSDDFEMRAPALRLAYRGTIDLDGNLNAKVEAAPLRDMWLVGPVVSTVLWPVTKLFEYRMTGNLNEPKTEPVYLLPKIIQMPFHPFRTLKGFFQEKPPQTPAESNSEDLRKSQN